MTNFHTAYLARKSNQIVNILGQLESSAEEKEQGIYELLNDVPVDCEVVIQKTIVGGKTHISSVDVQPKTIRLFEEFTPKADRAFNVVGKLFLAFLYCVRGAAARLPAFRRHTTTLRRLTGIQTNL